MLLSDADMETIDKLIKTYSVPCNPRILNAFQEAYAEEDVNFDKVIMIVGSDVNMASNILKLVNSPIFQKKYPDAGLFNSVDGAISFLGVERTYKTIQALAMKNKLTDDLRHTQFWDSATDVANISAYLSQKFAVASPDEAYMIGLFRDCGIPIMCQGLPDYENFLEEIRDGDKLQSIELEQKRFSVTHEMVGFCLASQWNLPDVICRSILTHEHIEPIVHEKNTFSGKKNMLVSLAWVAEYVSNHYRIKEKFSGEEGDTSGFDLPEGLAMHLGISEYDLTDGVEDTIDRLEELLSEYGCI